MLGLFLLIFFFLWNKAFEPAIHICPWPKKGSGDLPVRQLQGLVGLALIYPPRNFTLLAQCFTAHFVTANSVAVYIYQKPKKGGRELPGREPDGLVGPILCYLYQAIPTGSWHSLLVQCQTRYWKVASSSPGRRSRRIFFSRVIFLFWSYLVSIPPHVTPAAHKRSWPFCQN